MKHKMIHRIFLTLLATVVVGMMIAPFFMMISASLKSYAEVTAWPPRWIPEKLQWQNFAVVWKAFRRPFLNSFIVSVSTMLLCTSLGFFAAYAVSRIRFAGKRVFLFGLIITQMFSPVILIGPMYVVLMKMELLNHYLSLIIPNTAFALPMTVWLLVGYIDNISPHLEEAAMLDGCSRRQAVKKVLMPVLAPGLITAGLFAFIVSWNDLLFAHSFITKSNMRTISLALTSYQSLFETQWHKMMAASVISVIPVFLLFMVIQKHLVKGLASGSVKE